MNDDHLQPWRAWAAYLFGLRVLAWLAGAVVVGAVYLILRGG